MLYLQQHDLLPQIIHLTAYTYTAEQCYLSRGTVRPFLRYQIILRVTDVGLYLCVQTESLCSESRNRDHVLIISLHHRHLK